jgi:nucleoside-diphosphate-sugar epimerase
MVLGPSGFIGRWVARLLCQSGARATLVVRDAIAGAALFDRLGIIGDIVELDLRPAGKALGKLLKERSPDIVFNLAGYGIDRSERNESEAFAINRDLVEALCNGLAGLQGGRWGGLQVVHAGSAMEYGAIDGNLAEDSMPAPTTLYGRSKLAGTRMLTEACANNGLRGITARLFTVYGPGEQPGRLLPSLLESAATGHSLALTDGHQSRDFTYVEEVAEGLLRIGAKREFPETVVNLATGRLSTVKEFVETAADVLSMRSEQLKFGAIATREEEMHHRPVSIALLREKTGWAPKLDIRSGISRTVQFVNRDAGS